MELVLDISNWNGPISVALVQCWAQQGVRRVVVETVIPPANYPTSQTREQLQACKDAGMPTDCYVMYWPGQPVQRAVEAMHLADGFDIGYWFGDFEQDPPPGTDVVAEIEAFADATHMDGVYTRRDWWVHCTDDTKRFSNLMLWDADWNKNPAGVNRFVPYGGWLNRALQQFGSSNLCGTLGIDTSVINPEVFVPPSPYVGDDYYSKFGPDGNNTLANRYDWPAVAANLEGIIKQVAGASGAQGAACEEKIARIQQIVKG